MEFILLILLAFLLIIVTLIGTYVTKIGRSQFTVTQTVTVKDIEIITQDFKSYWFLLDVSFFKDNIEQIRKVTIYNLPTCKYKIGDTLDVIVSEKNKKEAFMPDDKYIKQYHKVLLIFGLVGALVIILLAFRYKYEDVPIVEKISIGFECFMLFLAFIYMICFTIWALKSKKKFEKIKASLDIKTRGAVSAVMFDKKNKFGYIVAEYTVGEESRFTLPYRLEKIKKRENIPYQVGDIVDIKYSEEHFSGQGVIIPG